ncbi:MAG: reverse transcriptase domain-containing protein [Desulfovibrionales bacterium]|nr:reverse transcriptase domain-containing protein [Desulfovibrionales bacterium]
MKTYNSLFDRVVSFENLLLAAQKAQKGKRFKESTALFNLELEKELVRLQKELAEMTYRHSPYHDFIVHDPKQRVISAAPYRDRVVHHALCNVIEPLFDKAFIFDSYACRVAKGTHAAVDRYTEFARKNKYVLKCDIQKYFQSVDHDILFEKISRKIRCGKTLWLIREIIGSRSDKGHMFYFPGDDLFTPGARRKGIPIGNLTSQFFANVYLNDFDHFVKEELRCKYYIRYVDDFVVFENVKGFLHEVRARMERHLESLRLRLHERKCRVYQTRDGVSFLGYRIFPTHRLLKKNNVLRTKRRLKRLSGQYRDGDVTLERINQSIRSWIGHASHADTYLLRSRVLGGVVFQRGEAKGAAGRFVEQQ